MNLSKSINANYRRKPATTESPEKARGTPGGRLGDTSNSRDVCNNQESVKVGTPARTGTKQQQKAMQHQQGTQEVGTPSIVGS